MFAHFHDQLTPFVGRTRALAEVAARLTSPECRLLTLVGAGGSGKTRLAIEAARVVKEQFPHGAVFVGLQPLSKSDLLVTTIARAVGLNFYGSNEPQAQLFNHLREKSLLLVLDNFEHLLEGAPFLSELLSQAPGVKLLVTSREVLNLQEEWLYPLKGMDTPLSIYSTRLEDYDAIQLFLYHARRMQPSFDLVHERQSVIQICSVAEGLPLAIELAASWLKGLSAAQIAAEMQRNLDFLATNTRNVQERHRSMRAVFDQSWKFLLEDERLIFAKLSIFPGGFDSDAAEQVADASFSCLSALVEKSLIQMESSDRYGIHEMLRQYGMEKLEDYSATGATYARFSQVFAQRMLRLEAELKQTQQLEAMQAIDSDFENIRLAWEWSAQNQPDNLYAMMNGLYLFGFLRSRYREIIAMFQLGLSQPTADLMLVSRLLARRWGYLHWLREGDYQEPLASLEQALNNALAENDAFEIAFCHLVTAFAMIGLHRYTDASPHLEASRTLFEAVNDPYYVCWVLHRLGYIYYNLNDSSRANHYTEQSLALARVNRNRASLVACLLNLASHHLLNSGYVKGKAYCEEALQVATESGHAGQTGHALSLLALCAFFQGDYAACADYAHRSMAINETIRPGVFQPYNQSLLILLACLNEDYVEGLRLGELGKRLTIDKMGFQLLYWSLAGLSAGLGKPAEVRDYLEKLLQVSEPEVNSVTAVWIVPATAYMLAETHPERAVELLAWAFAYEDLALNWARPWAAFERLQARLHAAIGMDAYETHWEKGQSLSLNTVKNYLRLAFSAESTLSTASADDAPLPILTARELEILHLLAAGLTNPQIAAELVIGAGTVKTHTLSIYRKLDVANRAQAIIRAQTLGLLAEV